MRPPDIKEFDTNLSGFDLPKQSICSFVDPPWMWGIERQINKYSTFLTRPNLCALFRMQLLGGKNTYTIFPPKEQEHVIFYQIHSETHSLLYCVNNKSIQEIFILDLSKGPRRAADIPD